ncbi:hypothetical protein ACIQH6_00925 [Micromonospora orduensis]|uniref:hypothetical protein n=1 Tax=Micromonospora orduensis TaxID=1420891 RepID=UPI0037F21866
MVYADGERDRRVIATAKHVEGRELDITEVLNLFSAAVSTVLAIVALWLSIVFYRLSNSEAQRSQRSAEEITASVKRLEALFGTMYSDTFAMMKDTVTDMRAHVWRAQVPSTSIESEVTAEGHPGEKLDAVKEAILKEIDLISQRIGVTETQLKTLRSEISPTVDRALTNSKLSGAWEADTIRLRRAITNHLQSRAMNLRSLRLSSGFLRRLSIESIVGQLIYLRARGFVSWDGPLQEIAEDAIIEYTGPKIIADEDLVGDSTFQVTGVNRVN